MLRISNIFLRPPTVHNLAEKELYEAHRSLLQAQAGLEWAQAMVTYHLTRINRLNAYFSTLEATENHDKNDPETPANPANPPRRFPRWNVRGSY